MSLTPADLPFITLSFEEAKKLAEVAVKTMSGATLPLLQLNVPLVVEAKYAKAWAEAH